MDFLDILLEAPTPKKTTIKAKSDGATDYTDDESTDTGTDDTSTDTDTDEDDDSSPTDYTESDDDSDPSTDGSDTDDDSDGPTDYTDSNDDSDGEDGSEDSTDDSTDDSTEDTDTSQPDPSEQENNRILLEDFSNMFYLVKNTITKLTNIDKSNILINKIVTQISSNLNVLKKQIFDYITFSFPKGKYVTNLYKYNYFLEAFKINVEMLKKISIFVPN
jgi:hypothetical protein